MTQQVTVSLLDLALLAILSSLFGIASVLSASVGIQLSRSRRGPPAPAPANPTPPNGPGRFGDPKWENVRNARLRMAGHRCELCNSSDVTLHAHHRTYARRGQETVEDLIILCRSCHGLFHKRTELAEREGLAARLRPQIVRLSDYPPASVYAMPTLAPERAPSLTCSPAGLEIALKILAEGKQPSRGEFKRRGFMASQEIADVIDWLAGKGQVVKSGQGAPTRWANGVSPACAPALADEFRPFCPTLPRFISPAPAPGNQTGDHTEAAND